MGDEFALFDAAAGGALLLTERCGGCQLDAASDPAAFFAQLEALAASGQWLALAADYELACRLETAVASLPKRARAPVRAWAFARGEWLTADQLAAFLAQQLAAVAPECRYAGVAEVQFPLASHAYAATVQQIRRWIADGDCYQINFTFPLSLRVYGDPLALYGKLRQRQPVRYGGFLRTPEESIVSLSPELFFERRGERVEMRPMKGTARRGATPAHDDAQRAALICSAKERAENIMIVDLLRNDLARLAKPGKVRVEALCETEAYPTLWQMTSRVVADLPGAKLADLFAALFPCGSVTGAPKIRAMQRIAELERAPRGLYTGSFGWLAPGGDCRFNVAIRTLELADEGQATLGIGSGIVADAEGDKEFAECLLKAQFLTGLDPGFELIETLRLADGAYPLLALHLERLQASASSLGFVCCREAIGAALANEASSRARGVFRVGLRLAHDGNFRLDCSPLVEDHAQRWSVVIAGEELPANQYLLRHKTSVRPRYERALAEIAAQPGVFDAIFVNQRGELCEGARSNLFIERGGVLLTPAATCGLLPGVLRRSLLASGRAVEAILHLPDLFGGSPIYVGNALRGLLPVTLRAR